MLPFFAVKFDLNYTLTAVLMLAALASSSLTQPLFGLWSDRHGALWLCRPGSRSAVRGSAWPPSPRATASCRARLSRRVSGSPRFTPRARSSPCSRAGASARAGCRCSTSAATRATRSARSSSRRSCCGSASGRGAARVHSRPPGRVRRARRAPVPRAAAPRAGKRRVRRRRGGQRAGDGRARRRDRAAERRLVRPAHLRAAVGRLARKLRGRRQPLLSLMLLSGAVGTLLLGPIADGSGSGERSSSPRRCSRR